MPNIIFDIPKVSLACFNLITVICPYFTVYEETWHLRFALDWTQVSLLKYWHASFFLKKRTLDKDYAGKTYHRKVMSVALNNFDVTFLPGLTTCYNYLTGQKMFRFGATWGERGLNRTNKCYQLNYPAVLLLKISIIYKFLSQILNFHWLLQELLSADRHRLSLGNTVYLSATPFISRQHLGPVHTETFSCIFVLFIVLKGIENNQLITWYNTKNAGKRFRVYGGPQTHVLERIFTNFFYKSFFFCVGNSS